MIKKPKLLTKSEFMKICKSLISRAKEFDALLNDDCKNASKMKKISSVKCEILNEITYLEKCAKKSKIDFNPLNLVPLLK